MAERTYRIVGQVKNEADQGIATVRVEAWDKDLLLDDFLAEAVTGPDGRFTMTFGESRVQEPLWGPRPDLIFKVFHQGQEIACRLYRGTEVTPDAAVSVIREAADLETVALVVDLAVPEPPEPPPPPVQKFHRVVGRLVQQETGKPLAGFTVELFDLEGEGAPRNLGRVLTAGSGLLRATVALPALDSATSGAARAATRMIRFVIRGLGDAAIYQADLEVTLDSSEIMKIGVPGSALPQPPSHPLNELAATVNLELPEPLLPFLAGKQIHSLEDVRRAGGLGRLADLPVPADHPAVRALDAHAVLSVLCDDPQVNAKLITRDYSSLAKIAATPATEFVSAMTPDLGDVEAGRIHARAQAQNRLLSNILAWWRGELVTRDQGTPEPPSSDPPTFTIWPQLQGLEAFADISLVYPVTCTCRDCEAAVSPLAYLADLLKYTLEHLRDDAAPVPLSYLEQTFHQPFGQLPARCDQVEREVRQVRLCSEALRDYVWSLGPGPYTLFLAECAYCLAAYNAILRQVGTTYEELRRVRTWGEEECRKLAQRLGISAIRPADSTKNTLLRLLLARNAGDPPSESDLLEQNLERLFGLADTNRNPLSDGPQSGLEDWQERWHLEGVEWGQNTDAQGRIHVHSLKAEPAGSVLQAWLYRDEQSGTENLVASGSCSASGPVGVPVEMHVAEENGSGLSGDLWVLPYSDVWIKLQAVPEFTAMRLAFLRHQWRAQDWPTDPYCEADPASAAPSEERFPAIDPDLIGPDDLRHPDEGQPPFDLWKKRREWADSELVHLCGVAAVGDLPHASSSPGPADGAHHSRDPFQPLFARMYHQPVTYVGAGDTPPWDTATPSASFGNLREVLTKGTKQEVTEMTIQLRNHLKLTVQAFLRLLEIRDKWSSGQAPSITKGTPITGEEWQEVFSILLQAQKLSLLSHWIEEEAKLLPDEDEILFGPSCFWIALREPQVGQWPVPRIANVPVIDPERVKLDDLPDSSAGAWARATWQERLEELGALRAQVETFPLTLDGFEEMVVFALGRTLAALDRLLVRLQSDDPAAVQQAEDTIVNDLAMTVESFRALMDLRARLAEPTPSPLKPDDLAPTSAALTTAYKVRKLYPGLDNNDGWITQESQSELPYWNLLKALLPPWRSSNEARRAWQDALRRRGQPPLIDPDLIDTADLKQPLRGKAHERWLQRQNAISGEKDQFRRGQENPLHQDKLAWIDTTFRETLAISELEYDALKTQIDEEISLDARLEQLSLTRPALKRIMAIRRLIASPDDGSAVGVLPSEWDEVYDILVQIGKRRRFAQWRWEEWKDNISLIPDHFRIAEDPPMQFPPPEPRPFLVWRATRRDRRDWQDRLQGRIDQQRTVLDGLAQAVSGTEPATLPQLRDGLVAASGKTARWLTDHLLIDCEAGGCQKTTRVAQAITTLQSLLFSLRTGLICDAYPTLGLLAEHFEEEWNWIGSYETWRAAMFVFLYPENILLPQLRRWQTPGFRNLVKELRSNGRLTPEDASAAAQRYADYFRDVCHLTLEASVQARTVYWEDDGRRTGDKGERYFVYLFARSVQAQNRVYYSRYDPEAPPDHAQSHWEVLAGLADVVKIVGATVYAPPNDRRRLFLFVRRQENRVQKLCYVTFDLETGIWASAEELSPLPEDATSFTAVVKQRSPEAEPPHLAIRLENGTVYDRKMNLEGTGWEEIEGDWWPVVPPRVGQRYGLLCGMIAATDTEYYMLFLGVKAAPSLTYRQLGNTDDKGPSSDPVQAPRYLTYRRIGKTDDGRWRDVSTAKSWVGGFRWPSNSAVYVLSKPIDAAPIDLKIIRRPVEELSIAQYKHDGDEFVAFNEWLTVVCGTDLKEVNVTFGYGPAAGPPVAGSERGIHCAIFAPGEYSPAYLIPFPRLLAACAGDYVPGQNMTDEYVAAQECIRQLAEKASVGSSSFWKDWGLADRILRQFVKQKSTWTSEEWEERGGALRCVLRELISSAQGIEVFTRPPDADEVSEIPFGRSDIDRVHLAVGEAPDEISRRIAYQQAESHDHAIYRSACFLGGENLNIAGPGYQAAPILDYPYDLSDQFSQPQLSRLRQEQKASFLVNAGAPACMLDYLEEAWYFVPVYVASQLQRRRQFTAALDWYRTVYNYMASQGDRKIAYLLDREGETSFMFARPDDWILDPLNPHAIAATRSGTYTQFTVLAIVNLLLEFADAEFTLDTPESLPRARTLYTTALQLLEPLHLETDFGACATVVDELDCLVASPGTPLMRTGWSGSLRQLKRRLAQLGDPRTICRITTEAFQQFQGDAPLQDRFLRADAVIGQALREQPVAVTFRSLLDDRMRRVDRAQRALLRNDRLVESVQEAALMADREYRTSSELILAGTASESATTVEHAGTPPLRVRAEPTPPTGRTRNLDGNLREAQQRPRFLAKAETALVPDLSGGFCVPPNPIPRALRLHAELNLYKLRHCRNIAGMERDLPLYAAPTDVLSGLPSIGAGGQLVLPGTTTFAATPYRYDYLIERARQLGDRAAQMEAAFLAALEKRDAEYYNQLKARQDIQLARAGVRLQDLRVREAEDGVTLAELQRDQAQVRSEYYQGLIDEGLLASEQWSFGLLIAASVYYTGAAIAALFPLKENNVAASLGSLAQASATAASAAAQWAAYERRAEEWGFQRDLAGFDIQIGAQAVTIALDRVRVVDQEYRISQLQTDFAVDIANFLATKFTNVELYEWMSGILEGVYSYFLTEATAVAKLAEAQLAFERQESPPAIIQADYWEAPADDALAASPGETAPDRRGLTGSARLSADIQKLDQYRFETERRKLQLTKTISLARVDPFAFQQFRETGVLKFSSTLETFDRDFPGHYLRLVKRVRTSVVALIPPTAGIHATLSTGGLSRVAVNSGGLFQTNLVRRAPESVALTSPNDATGLFELLPQNQEMLFPFEGLGVDTSWELRLPKPANLFDYRTIADVLLTLEYTALDSYDYRQQIMRDLDTRFSADRPYSFRHQFADAWYDLHNPAQTAAPMVVRFRTRREDFPPNLENLKIAQLVLYFAHSREERFEEVSVERLTFLPQTQASSGAAISGGEVTTVDGVISTRRGNAGSWLILLNQEPAGQWELALPNTVEMRRRFEQEEVEDILFVITYSGDTPAWSS